MQETAKAKYPRQRRRWACFTQKKHSLLNDRMHMHHYRSIASIKNRNKLVYKYYLPIL